MIGKKSSSHVRKVRNVSSNGNGKLYTHFNAAVSALDDQFVERTEVLHGAMVAVLAQKHHFQIGPKGVTKSLLVEKVCETFADSAYFEHLVNKFTKPEDLFGPIRLSGLKKDVYRRNIDGMFPSVHFAFLDEFDFTDSLAG